jgi:predicted AlkP superfamily phosphohydrolase/phosphomutase
MGACFVPALPLVDEVVRRLDASRERQGSRVRRWFDGFLTRDGARGEVGGRNAFAVHTDSVASAIRVNLIGRDPQGRVRADALDEYRDFLAAGFAALTDPATGRRLVSEVVRVAERYRGPRAPFADLLVVWNAAAPIAAVASPAIGVVHGVPPGHPIGNHRPGGWFVAAGPGIAPAMASAPMAIVDFAPTVAALLGVDLGDCAGSAPPFVQRGTSM